MRLLRLAVLLFVATSLSPWLRGSLSAQTAEQKKHPKFQEMTRHALAAKEAHKNANYDLAVHEAEDALKLGLEIFGEDDQLIAALYNLLGGAWKGKGKYDAAISNYEKALKIGLKALGEENYFVATFYSNLGGAWGKKGDYGVAISYYEKALKIGLKTRGENDPSIGTFYNNLGSAWTSNGEYDKAIGYYEMALKIELKTLGPDDPAVAVSYNNLGVAWAKKSEYDRAIRYYEMALKIDVKTLGEEHPKVATRYNNLGSAWENKGEHDKAIGYYEKALKVDLKTFGEEHPDVATRYSNLAGVWETLGDYAKAIGYYEKALQIDLRILGEENPDVATLYNNLGHAWNGKGGYNKAIEYQEKAVKIGLKVLGDKHLKIAIWHNNLGNAWQKKGEYEKAIRYFEKAQKILELSLARHEYLTSLGNLADILVKTKDANRAASCYANLIEQLLKYRLELSSEKSQFTARYVQYFNQALSFELSQNNHAKAFEYDSLRRGLSLAEALSLKDALAQGGVTPAEQKQMLDLASEIESLRAQQAAALNRSRKDKADELLQQIFAKEKQKDELDQKLTKAYPKYGEIRFPKAPSAESIQKSLKDNEVFVSYFLAEEKPVAFVVDKKAGLKVISLSPQSPLPQGEGKKEIAWKTAVSNFHALHTGNTGSNIVPVTGKDGIIYWNSGAQQGKYDLDKEGNITATVHRRERGMQTETAGKAQFEKISIGKAGEALTPDQIIAEREKLRVELFNAFIAPIQKEYPSAKNWVVSPDGPLYYLPFPLLEGKTLKMPDVTLAHSAVVWQKLRGQEPKPAAKTLLAFGNAVYGSGHSDVRGSKAGKRRSASAASEERLGKMRIYGSQDTSELQWDNLEGTGAEVKGIAALAYADGKAKEENVYTGVAANVDRVLSLKEQKRLGDYKYIHFAVHGLFVDGNPALNALVMTLPEKAKQHKTDEYNAYIKKQQLKADGYLRAGDISALNLNAELVVMSACETSLGHEVGGEGMVALPQSFLTAGARSVVASLWSVDDAATSLFMQRFYKYLLTEKQKPKIALANTQRDFREGKEFAQYRDPFYWAAFVMYGE